MKITGNRVIKLFFNLVRLTIKNGRPLSEKCHYSKPSYNECLCCLRLHNILLLSSSKSLWCRKQSQNMFYKLLLNIWTFRYLSESLWFSFQLFFLQIIFALLPSSRSFYTILSLCIFSVLSSPFVSILINYLSTLSLFPLFEFLSLIYFSLHVISFSPCLLCIVFCVTVSFLHFSLLCRHLSTINSHRKLGFLISSFETCCKLIFPSQKWRFHLWFK